jgi:hypothetical protein
MKMDNPRFLFVLAVVSLILLALASSGTKVIGPCDCTPLEEGKFRATFINGTDDQLVNIRCHGNKKGGSEFTLSPGMSGAVDLSKEEAWTYSAYKKPVDPPNAKYLFVRKGDIPGPVAITIN